MTGAEYDGARAVSAARWFGFASNTAVCAGVMAVDRLFAMINPSQQGWLPVGIALGIVCGCVLIGIVVED